MKAGRGLLGESTLYLVGNVASRIVAFIMIPFYSRFLSAGQYGILNLIELATTVVAIAFGLQTVGAAMTRLVHDAADARGRHQAASTCLLVGLALSALIAALAAMAAHPLAQLINLPEQEGLLRAAFLAMFFGNMTEAALVHERIERRAWFYVGYTVAAMLATVALNIWFIGFAHRGVWGFVLSKLCVMSVGFVFLLARAFREIGVHWRPALLPRMARFGLPLVFSSVAIFAIHFSDRIFLAHSASLADVGRYSLAYNFAFLLSVIIGDSFTKSWNVSIYRYAEQPGWQARFARVATWLVLILAAAAMGIALLALDTLRLLVPASYYPPLLMLPVLVFAYFFREVGDFFASLLLINRRSGQVGRISIACAAVNVTLNFGLISYAGYGVYGAAIATLLTWIVYLAICWVAAGREHRVPYPLSALARMLGVCVVTLVGYAAVRPAAIVASLMLDVVLFGLFLLAAAAFYLRPGDRREGIAWVRKAAIARGSKPLADPGQDGAF